MKTLTFHVRGPFVITDHAGRALDLRKVREKGLMALLAFAPKHRRTRTSLATMLWPRSEAVQARNSLRRALADIRKALGDEYRDCLGNDGDYVCLNAHVRLDYGDDGSDAAELLEDVNVPGEPFEDWLRDLRAGDTPAPPRRACTTPIQLSTTAQVRDAGPLRIGLMLDLTDATREETFLAQNMADTVADVLSSAEGVQVVTFPCAGSLRDDQTLSILVEMHSTLSDRDWYLRARVSRGGASHYFASARERFALPFRDIVDAPRLRAFALGIRNAVTRCLSRHAMEMPPYARMIRASEMLFSGNAAAIAQADDMLCDVVRDTGSGTALAWRAYARMTRMLEFRDLPGAERDEAAAFLSEAMALAGDNAQVRALAAIVNFKLLDDIEYGHHLAQTAVKMDDQNAYVLDAYSQSLFLLGEHDRGYHASNWARQAAQPLPNAFNWDMGSSLSALSLGRVDEAIERARASHLKCPHYRPALRYLFALNLLSDNIDAAHRYRGKLQKVEPDFRPDHILDPTYPMASFRWLGLDQQVIPRLVA